MFPAQSTALPNVPRPAPVLVTPLPADFKSLSCSDACLLILNDSRTVELRALTGESLTRTFSMVPSSSCALSTYPAHWIIGFQSGVLSEFDSELNLIRSYRERGEARAHSSSITQVYQTVHPSGLCSLVSVADDDVINFWSTAGQFLHQYVPPKRLVQVSAAPLALYAANDQSEVTVISLGDFSRKTFRVGSPIVSIAAIHDGIAALVGVSEHRILLVDSNGLRSKFEFGIGDKVVKIVPLTVETESGLITYLAVDQFGKVTMRGLDQTSELEFAQKLQFVAESPCSLVVRVATMAREKFLYVYNRDEVVITSMSLAEQVLLPRADLVSLFAAHAG
jgi:hypothetical protein